jgi:cytochrome b561
MLEHDNDINDTNAPPGYGAVAKSFHWLVALFMIGAFLLGMSMVDLPLSPQKLRWYSYHKWLGVTVFWLATLRIAWRAFHPGPPLPATIPSWRQAAIHCMHWVLYALMFAIPLSGWLFSAASGVPVVYLGMLPLPSPVGKDAALAEVFKSSHLILAYCALVLVLIHIGAALQHHFTQRDGVLARMLPFVKPGKDS